MNNIPMSHHSNNLTFWNVPTISDDHSILLPIVKSTYIVSLNFKKVMNELLDLVSGTGWGELMEDRYTSEEFCPEDYGELPGYRDRDRKYQGESLLAYTRTIFHTDMLSMNDVFEHDMVLITSLIWEVLGYTSRYPIIGESRLRILRSNVFKRHLDMASKLSLEKLGELHGIYLFSYRWIFNMTNLS